MLLLEKVEEKKEDVNEEDVKEEDMEEEDVEEEDVEEKDVNRRGGRLTSLDASFMQCFVFFKHRQKHRGRCFFSKHR